MNNNSEKKLTAEDLLQLSLINGIQVSPDETKIVYSVRKTVMTKKESCYLTHIYKCDVDGKNNIQLTRGDVSCTSPQWSPAGNWISFLSKRKGKKNIWLLPSNGGEAFPVTCLFNNAVKYQWSPNGESIAFTMKEPPTPGEIQAFQEKREVLVLNENIKGTNLWILPLTNLQKQQKPIKLTDKSFCIKNFDWSPDGKEIVFDYTKTGNPEDDETSRISRIAIDTGEITPVTDPGVCSTTSKYSSDGKWIAFCESEVPYREFAKKFISIIPSKGREAKKLAETPNQHPLIVRWINNDSQIVFMEHNRTSRALYKLPVNGEPPELFSDTSMILSSPAISPSGNLTAFKLQNINTPEEVYITKTNCFKPVKLTDINREWEDIPMGKTEVIRWKSRDGIEIEGLLTYPLNYDTSKKYPLLVEIHGGPDSLFLRTFLAAYHYNFYPHSIFSQQGYLILRPNYRGSNGYGADFRKAISKDFGGNDTQDVLNGVDFLIEKGIADKDKLGIMGWSFGGYLTAMIISKTDRFKAATFGAGLSNLVSLSTTTLRTQSLPAYMGINLWDDFDLVFSHSPLKYAKNINTPLLMFHGEKDLMSPVTQGLELYNTLRLMGKPVKMVIYPRARHILHEPKQCTDLLQRNLDWFNKHIPVEK